MKRLALVVLALVGCDPRGPAPRSFDELVIVGECANGDAAIDAVAALRPDIVFLDVQMPGADGFDVLAALLAWRSRGPSRSSSCSPRRVPPTAPRTDR
jgi:CheY-like chemotaxis protein